MTKTVLFCFLIFSGALYAQENKKYHGPIITDRPDQTESPFLIPKGLLQIETGVFL